MATALKHVAPSAVPEYEEEEDLAHRVAALAITRVLGSSSPSRLQSDATEEDQSTADDGVERGTDKEDAGPAATPDQSVDDEGRSAATGTDDFGDFEDFDEGFEDAAPQGVGSV